MANPQQAKKYFEIGCIDLQRGQLDKAIKALEMAVRFEPQNPVYKRKLKEARDKHRKKSGSDLDLEISPAAKRMAVLVTIALMALFVSWLELGNKEPPPENMAEKYKNVANFRILFQSSEGVWNGILEENLAKKSLEEQRKRCKKIAAQLPKGKLKHFVTLHAQDGVSISCKQP